MGLRRLQGRRAWGWGPTWSFAWGRRRSRAPRAASRTAGLQFLGAWASRGGCPTLSECHEGGGSSFDASIIHIHMPGYSDPKKFSEVQKQIDQGSISTLSTCICVVLMHINSYN